MFFCNCMSLVILFCVRLSSVFILVCENGMFLVVFWILMKLFVFVIMMFMLVL